MNVVKRTWIWVGSVATIVVLFIAVFPARTYLDQQHQRQQVLAEIKTDEARNRELQKRIAVLHTDAEVERLARAEYNLVRPGEEAYAVLPTRQPPAPPPKPAPKSHPGWLSRTWAQVTSIF